MRKTRLKTLIKLGKDRGFLTYAEVNDHLPDDAALTESRSKSPHQQPLDMGIQTIDLRP